MIEPLTEDEIKDFIDGPGPLNEKIVVYGWDRIAATMVLSNVLRKRLAEARAEFDAYRNEREPHYRQNAEAAIGALKVLRRAMGAYSAKHKVDKCYCPTCNVTRGAMDAADRVLGKEGA